MPDNSAAHGHLADQEKEYGTYVAVEPIFVEGVRAFNPGDAVPIGHVKNNIVHDSLVAKTGTKAAQAVVAAPQEV